MTVTTIAAGVRQVTVGPGPGSHVYLLDSDEGVIAFDAGIKGSGPDILAAAGGRLAKVILSHSHVDHRGGASELNAPVFCHPDEVADAEGDAGRSYIDFDRIANEQMRGIIAQLNAIWDGGPVTISGTVEEGEEIAGFGVLHVPGHAPGQIALFRESDGLLLAADTIYTVDLETGQEVPARVPHPATNIDTDLARKSIARLASLRPTSAWAGHADHVTGDVKGQLQRAADGAEHHPETL
jgi:glyoxylase-like metal-dependent hydrolase (beta-lactamase superfamily II)